MTNFIKKNWPLLILFIGAIFIRFYGLLSTPISLFSDEIDMGYQAQSLVKTGCDYSGHCFPIQFHSFSDVQPPIPIYFIALFHVLGIPVDYSIRLVSALAGLLGIVVTYLLFENLISKKIFDLRLPGLGFVSSLLLIIMPWHFTYSRIGFALPLLYLFVVSGLYFFTEYLIKNQNRFLYLACLLLGLTPMVYNTAKMAIVFYPAILLILPKAYDLFKRNLSVKLSLLLMFVPLVAMFINGGTSARFDYISIFTDPTVGTEVSYQRLLDSGPQAAVGSSPSILTKLIHNKPLWYLKLFSDNAFHLISTDFLFLIGDPNLRHSPANWGMLYRSSLLLLALGLYYLIRSKQDRLVWFLLSILIVSISTSAITRDGGSHASRSFMMILPILFVMSIGLVWLKEIKIIYYGFCTLLLVESLFFLHDYWFHYRYASEKSWSAGMKDLIASITKNKDKPVVVSPKGENPLIFYLYYTDFDPRSFQELSQTNTIYRQAGNSTNIDGNQIGNTNFYIGSVIDYSKIAGSSLKTAKYYLTKMEYENTSAGTKATIDDIIKLPSGEPLYYEVHY